MAIGFGYEGWVGLGTESTYGTPQTISKYLEINSESLAMEDDVVVGNSTFNNAIDVDNIAQGRKKVGGGLSFDLRREGAEAIFAVAMGTVVDTALEGGTLCYSHDYAISDTIGTSLCVAVDRDVATYMYDGVKINEMTINGDNEGIVTVDLTCLAEDEGTVAGTSSPSFSTSDYWTFDKATLTYGGTARNITAWKLTLNQNLTDDRYFWGTRTMQNPQRAGRLSVTGEMTTEFDGTTDWYDLMSAGTREMVITYTGDKITGTTYQQIKFTLPKVRFTGGVPNVSDSGRILTTLPFVAYADGTTKPLSIQSINSVASGIL